MPWTDENVPGQVGRTVLVTGATDGLGLRTAVVLAARGARVLMTYRDEQVAASAIAAVGQAATGAEPELIPLDLMSLSSVAAAADLVRERTGDRLDLLVNDAGIMAPRLEFSADGIESQWATNVVGHAALTWRLLPSLSRLPGSRVVTVTSIAHWGGRLDRERIRADVRGERYRRFRYYFRAKLADLVLARELQRRLIAAGAATISVAAHPGLGATNIATSTTKDASPFTRGLVSGTYQAISQPVERAALPLLFAATRPGLRGGELIGPPLWLQTRGYPTLVRSSRASRDRRLGKVLWEELEAVTGLAPNLVPR